MMKFKRAVQILFVYTLIVIVWGAWVRISHSGDGCGETWPLCQGRLVPEAAAGKTWVEYAHRATSGAYGIFVLILWILIRRQPLKAHPSRRAVNFVLLFTITEALLGAKLVLLGLVSVNASVGRTLVMALHQVNSLLLTGSVTALYLSIVKPNFSWRPRGGWVGVLFCAIAVTGSWAALASTLFPAESLWEGLMKDFEPGSHHLLRLRILHPLIALLGGGSFSLYLWMRSAEDSPDRDLNLQTALIVIGALLFGACTLFLLSPTWMKLTHLAIAHIAWAALVRWALPGTRAST